MLHWLKAHLGFVFLSTYVALLICAYVALILSSASNAADSGEGGIVLLLFAWPWVSFFSPAVMGLGIVVNGLLAYGLGRIVGALLSISTRHP